MKAGDRVELLTDTYFHQYGVGYWIKPGIKGTVSYTSEKEAGYMAVDWDYFPLIHCVPNTFLRKTDQGSESELSWDQYKEIYKPLRD